MRRKTGKKIRVRLKLEKQFLQDTLFHFLISSIEARKVAPSKALPPESEHLMSCDSIAQAWDALGLNPDDYAYLGRKLGAACLKVCVKFTTREWLSFFKAFQECNMEALLPQVYKDFYENSDWVTTPKAKVLASIERMPYRTPSGIKSGTIELVQLKNRVGIRALVPYVHLFVIPVPLGISKTLPC